jgi:hypothetical protein
MGHGDQRATAADGRQRAEDGGGELGVAAELGGVLAEGAEG